MKKVLRLSLCVLLAFSLVALCVACEDKPKVDYGTLTVANVTLVEGESKQIEFTFSDKTKAEPITYTFEGNDVAIKDGIVTALVGGKTVTVTAKTEHHETTFTVNTTAIDYGTLTVADITVEEEASATIAPTFSISERAEEITYTFDSDAISIENGTVTALKGGATVTVTAKTAHHETTFTVNTTAIDYGTLTVTDMEGLMEGGEQYKIRATFSISERAEEITYTFEGNDIAIENGYVTALVGGKTVTVTAKTAHHETTFTVKTLIDYGALNVANVYAWVGYPASNIDVEFEKPERAEQLTFDYDADAITIDTEKMTVTALKAGAVEVTAHSENFTKTFTVYAENVDKTAGIYNTSNYNAKVAGYKNEWANKGTADATTIFIGDSFFDAPFWTDFYTTYAGKDVLLAGVSSSTSCDWEVFTESYLKETDPKNLVMHMGTNNVYDDQMNAEQTVSALQRMFYVIHNALPEAKIYYFNISQRSYDDAKKAIVSNVNKTMAAWAEKREWLTLINTADTLTADMLKDSVHPKVENYSVFVNALAATDIEIMAAPVKEGVGFTSGSYDKTAGTFTMQVPVRTRAFLMDGPDAYKGNFAISGTAKIAVNNGWIEFMVSDAPEDKWFAANAAMPVSTIIFADGNSAIWGYKNGGPNIALGAVNAGGFDFKVILLGNKLLFKVGEYAQEIHDDAFTNNAYFAFGGEGTTLEVSNLSVTIGDNDAIQSLYDAAVPKNIRDINMLKTQHVWENGGVMMYNGATLNRNYVLQGKLDIVDTAGNPHLQFKFTDDNNRILLWDNETKGMFKVSYACAGNYNNVAPEKDIFTKVAGQTLTITWKLVVTDNDAYLYMNDALRLVWKNIPGDSLTISGESVDGKFYDMSAVTQKDDKEKYDAEIAAINDVITAYAASAAGTHRPN